jgi:hypothetical protein
MDKTNANELLEKLSQEVTFFRGSTDILVNQVEIFIAYLCVLCRDKSRLVTEKDLEWAREGLASNEFHLDFDDGVIAGGTTLKLKPGPAPEPVKPKDLEKAIIL